MLPQGPEVAMQLPFYLFLSSIATQFPPPPIRGAIDRAAIVQDLNVLQLIILKYSKEARDYIRRLFFFNLLYSRNKKQE